jgi:DNA repair exonuclease SbcCD ATPase subunit
MTFKCIHIADIHFRGLQRHEEYKKVFSKFFEKAKQLNPDVIFVGGDIVHSKTSGISPELIDTLNWWFTGLSSVAPTHIILGNHDGLIQNTNRLDAISPIIDALNNPLLHLYKKSGVYKTGIPGFNWCVFSCFDHENWNNVLPVNGDINIAAFHGAVKGSTTDVNWELEGEVDLNFFEKFDFAFLGDIHKMQYLDFEQKIAYSGSTIQQNFGESIDKGFLFWEIESKNNYKSTFYSIENENKFITVNWNENFDKTIDEINKLPNFSRFRIKSDQQLDKNDIKLLQNFLKENKNALEVVFKYEHNKKNNDIVEDKKKNFNIFDDNIRFNILKSYFDESVTNEQIIAINNICKNAIDKLQVDQYKKSISWELKNIAFNNLFCYGENNFLNFENMNGIIGIFGKNASGKSSIPGSLMYSLFNTTDRGSMKNLHIINTRKEDCSSKIEIAVNNQKYLIERNTKKSYTKRKNDVNTSTNLNIFKVSDNGLLINETDEQRRETEKILKDLIGTADDFLMTSFASQGNINAFIGEKSANRKHFLSKFMNLDIFEEISKLIKDDSSDLKAELKVFNQKNWKDLINKSNEEINENLAKIDVFNNDLNVLKQQQLNISIDLENIKNNNQDLNKIKSIEDEIKLLSFNIDKENKNLIKIVNDCEQIQQKIDKFNILKEQIDLNQLKKDKERLINLKSQLTINISQLDTLKNDIEKRKNAHKLLSSVPCGDNFPSCRFIKNAYEDFKNISSNEDSLKNFENAIAELKNIVNDLEKDQIQQKIDKFEEFSMKNEQNIFQLSILLDNKEALTQKTYELTNKLNDLNDKLEYMTKSVDKNDNNIIKSYQNELDIIKSKIQQTDSSIVKYMGNNQYLLQMIEKYSSEEIKYTNLLNQWKLYELVLNAVSKKGLPSKLIKEMLPSLNNEIKEILTDAVDFSIDIEIDDDDLEIYINYNGDKRIIETASGMEKMITSMAIRVALINISNLPKSNIFIIDEGFGALDDTNIIACIKLLNNFKKFFKTILVISHIDIIKDIVDNNLCIENEGLDSYVRFE